VDQKIEKCECGSNLERYELKDAHGIFLRYVCNICESKIREGYNAWVFDGYDQDFLIGNELISKERVESRVKIEEEL